MGDNGTDNLDQQSDDLSYADYAYEDYAGGTDSSYYDDDEYNYEDSAEPDQLRDLDESNEFNTFGGDDQYTKQFGNGGTNDDDAESIDDDESVPGSSVKYDSAPTEDFTDDFDEPEEDNFDGEEKQEKGKNQEQDADGQPIGTGDESGQITETEDDSRGKGKKKEPDGPIKWKKGDEITLELLNQIWKDCKDLEQVRPMAESANKAVVEAINSLGPNLMLKLNNYITKTTDSKQDTIGCLLDLASRTGKRLTYTAMSVVEAIFDQQWTQTTILATLPSVLKTAIATNPLKGILNAIFSVAVPVINAKARKNN